MSVHDGVNRHDEGRTSCESSHYVQARPRVIVLLETRLQKISLAD